MRSSRLKTRRAGRRPGVPVLLVAILLAAAVPVCGDPAFTSPSAARGVDTIAVDDGQGDRDEALWAGISADVRDQVYDDTAGSLSRYRIEVEIIPPAGEDALTTIEGTVDLLVVNSLDDPMDEVVFRLYSNDDRYGAGSMEMDDVEVGGEAAEVDLSVSDTVATVALPDELVPGAAAAISYDFTGVVDNDPAGSYGMYTYSPASGTMALAHWYPVLAGITPGGDWNTEPVSVNSDPIFTGSALYDVSLTMPDGWQVASSGVEVASDDDDGRSTRQFVTGPSRDFTIVADETFERSEQRVGDTVVISWFEPEDEEGGEAVLGAGVASLEQFEPLLGDYPYGEMDLVQVSVGNGAAGIEFPQLMFIGGSYYNDPPTANNRISFLESLVVHEVMHQWFYGLVGNDHYDHAWQDESLANFLMVYFYGLEYDPGHVRGRLPRRHRDPVPALPVWRQRCDRRYPVGRLRHRQRLCDRRLLQGRDRAAGHPRRDRRRGVLRGTERLCRGAPVRRGDAGRSVRGLGRRLRRGPVRHPGALV